MRFDLAQSLDVLRRTPGVLHTLLGGLPDPWVRANEGPDTFSPFVVVGHLIDGERMFAYRMFRISRGDQTPIEGFEQDGYIENAHSNQRSFADLLDEFSLLRRANMIFFSNLDDDAWGRIGTANNVKISVRALTYIMAGHIEHHLGILKERYLG